MCLTLSRDILLCLEKQKKSQKKYRFGKGFKNPLSPNNR